jgi:hypothetical protein
MATLCAPCVDLLREMCRIGGPEAPTLCQIAADYVTTGDPDLVGRAAALAPGVAWQARRALQARGVLPLGRAERGTP